MHNDVIGPKRAVNSGFSSHANENISTWPLSRLNQSAVYISGVRSSGHRPGKTDVKYGGQIRSRCTYIGPVPCAVK